MYIQEKTLMSGRKFGSRGFSMIEMMISITIGMFIIIALIAVLVSNANSNKANDRTSELQSNGRYALEDLKRELRHAGFRGFSWGLPLPVDAATVMNVTNECLDGVGGAAALANKFVTNIGLGIWGANDSNPYSGNCLPAAQRLRGDVLVIRRVANTQTTALDANSLYFRSTYAFGAMFQGTVPPPGVVGPPVATFPLQAHVYYIGPSDAPDQNVPALRRVTLVGKVMVDQMVVSGIEQMQVTYAITDTALNTQYYNADNVKLTGASTSAVASGWNDVNSVRIWLLARNAKTEPGYQNTNSYVMGDKVVVANDSFRRQLYTTVVQLRN